MCKTILIIEILLICLMIEASIGYYVTDKKKRNVEPTKGITFLEKYPLIDGHNDLSYMILENFQNQFAKFDLNDLTKYTLNGTDNVTHTDIIRLKKGRLGGQFWAIYADCNTQGKDAVRVHLEQIDLMQRIFEKFPDVFQLVWSSEDIMYAFKNKRVASMFGVEGGHAIDSSLAMLRIYHQLGVRYMTLTHNCNTPWADNNLVDSNQAAFRHDGLTDFGKRIIQEMNRIGIIVDISHVSNKTMLDAMEVSKAPVMFSHSSVYSICNHTRNVHDKVLLKLKEKGGVIMINFYNGFVTCSDNAVLADVVKHINYVRDLIGYENIGIGADYDGVPRVPTGLEDVSKYPDLFEALLDDGWSEENLAKLAGGNVLRVLKEVEKYSESMESESPIDDIIEDKYLEEYRSCRTNWKSKPNSALINKLGNVWLLLLFVYFTIICHLHDKKIF